MSSNPNRQKFFTQKQVAEMLSVSVRTVSRWIKKGINGTVMSPLYLPSLPKWRAAAKRRSASR
jgi:transposase